MHDSSHYGPQDDEEEAKYKSTNRLITDPTTKHMIIKLNPKAFAVNLYVQNHKDG
jgi:hypothetical protein